MCVMAVAEEGFAANSILAARNTPLVFWSTSMFKNVRVCCAGVWFSTRLGKQMTTTFASILR